MIEATGRLYSRPLISASLIDPPLDSVP